MKKTVRCGGLLQPDISLSYAVCESCGRKVSLLVASVTDGICFKDIEIVVRPSWHEYFLNIAKVVRERSHDIHTQHGCVIVNKRNQIIGTGYNGFPRDLNDARLPTERPDKYDWMEHSEYNAILNCTIPPVGGSMYVTGPCCFSCLKMAHQSGIEHVYWPKGSYAYVGHDEQKPLIEKLLSFSKMKVNEI